MVSSAVEHCLHTAGVTGSIPVPPTKFSTNVNQRCPETRDSSRLRGFFLARNAKVCPLTAGGKWGAILRASDRLSRGVAPMPLADTAIRNAKPSEKSIRLFDGGGLYIEVSPSGGQVVAIEVPLRRQGKAVVPWGVSRSRPEGSTRQA
uniref:Uncharacterized protein n=1 Tax=Ralstonia solanacearum TaxID=305 RepID=A0A0S4U8C8_RALSL|nr:protein of unknown function [Ralstonia solanacearum]